MKDSLFEMMMAFFEKSLSQLKENKSPTNNSDKEVIAGLIEPYNDAPTIENQSLIVRAALDSSVRVFTYEEQTKFTKASYQFLMRMLIWGVIASENIELVINQLIFSESRYVTLEETKWTIRNTLAESLDAVQLAFLDLVLYQKEDELPLH